MDLKPAQETNGQRPARSPPASHGKPDSDGFSWLQPLGLAFLTFNSVVALYRSRNDPWGVAFVATSYVDLLLLFWCLRRFESTPDGSPHRRTIKMAVWSLSTLLTVMFSYRVAAIMPLAIAVVVWAMAGLTIAAGFYAFFIYDEKKNPTDVPNPSKISTMTIVSLTQLFCMLMLLSIPLYVIQIRKAAAVQPTEDRR